MKLHRTELPYDPTPRSVAQDATLPFDALGVWVWARSLPDGADLSTDAVEAAHRGLGADRAAKAVRALRAHGLWHTLTFRLGPGVTSRVVVPPEPWTRDRAAEVLGLDPAELVEGPSDRRHLQAVSAGHADTRISEGQLSEGQRAEGQRTDPQPAGDHSLLEQKKRTTPLTPRTAGETPEGCNQGHKRAVRGCCARNDLAARRAAAKAAADLEADRARLAAFRGQAQPFDADANARGVTAGREALAARHRGGKS